MAKTKEITRDFLPDEDLNSDVPWFWPEMMDANQSVRWWSWMVKMLSFVQSSWVTGSINFTWFWFTPRLVNITAVPTTSLWTEAVSNISYQDWVTSWYVIWSWGSSDRTSSIVSVFDPSNATRATFSSFDADWLTLSFSQVDFNTFLTITCYS